MCYRGFWRHVTLYKKTANNWKTIGQILTQFYIDLICILIVLTPYKMNTRRHIWPLTMRAKAKQGWYFPRIRVNYYCNFYHYTLLLLWQYQHWYHSLLLLLWQYQLISLTTIIIITTISTDIKLQPHRNDWRVRTTLDTSSRLNNSLSWFSKSTLELLQFLSTASFNTEHTQHSHVIMW